MADIKELMNDLDKFKEWYDSLEPQTKQHIKNANVWYSTEEQMESFIRITIAFNEMVKMGMAN